MLRLAVLGVLLFSAVFIISPAVVSREDPYVIDDFESGLGRWFGDRNGVAELTKDAHDGDRAMKVTWPKGDASSTVVMTIKEGAKYLKLVDKGYEAFNFWVKGIEGTEEAKVRFHLLGIGDHATDNRWQANFNAPLDEWTLISMPFTDLVGWNQEKGPFKIELLDYPGFLNAAVPWPDQEFIVDQMEVGYITEMKPKAVEPLEKLPVAWGMIKEH